MIKKYKIACCVLGAIVLVLILALAITVFVFAGNIKAADGVENASGDIADDRQVQHFFERVPFLFVAQIGIVCAVFIAQNGDPARGRCVAENVARFRQPVQILVHRRA